VLSSDNDNEEPVTSPVEPMQEDPNADEDLLATGNGRKAVENSLRQPIVVDHFPSALAGAPIDSNQKHSISDSHPNNPYAPFASRLDWEVARWAKLRGPSSTAISELLSIPGVSYQILTHQIQQ
jgi:hypothetical protein